MLRLQGFKSRNMLDFGLDVNILLRKTWEVLGKPKLVYSPIQLWMENHYYILPVGRLKNVEVNIVGVKNYSDLYYWGQRPISNFVGH